MIGRGTSDPDANGNVAKVARMLWEGMGFGWAEVGYSGVAHPRVDALLERAARLGFRRIVVFPYFLFTGVLVRRIYAQTDVVAARHPEIEFVKAGYLNDHPLVLDTFVERIQGITAGDVNMNCLLCKYRERIIGHEGAVGAPQQGIIITSRVSARTHITIITTITTITTMPMRMADGATRPTRPLAVT